MYPRTHQWISKVYKLLTLSRQVFASLFSPSIVIAFSTLCIFIFNLSRNLQYMKFWRLSIVMHFIPVTIRRQKVNFELKKPANREKKKFILNFISVPLMRTKRWCVSFTSDTLVLFQFYWHVFFCAYLSHSFAIQILVRDRLHIRQVCIELAPPLLVWFIFLA